MQRSGLVALVAAAGILLSSVALAQKHATQALPLKRVRLYEVGVGYFERTGKLRNGSPLTLPLPVGHLDDALKTLVVVNADGKTTVSGIDFGSSVSRSMGRALAGLPADSSEPLSLNALLRSLKGSEVEVLAQGKKVQGRLVDVVDPEHSNLEVCLPIASAEDGKSSSGKSEDGKACRLRKETAVLLLTSHAEIRRFSAMQLSSVRPLDPGMQARLGGALDAVSRKASRSQRGLTVRTQGGSAITLGYVAEAPVWRSNYRLVLGADDRAELQGWALVHNDTDEVWKQVQVDLVNGRPDSFLFPMAAPRYARRELVTPDDPLSTVPQLLDRVVDDMWEEDGVGGIGLAGIGEGGGGRGEGIGLGSIGTIGHGSGYGSSGTPSSRVSVGTLAALAGAQGVEAGALFRYTLPAPLDLRAHGSALVPFAQEQVGARRIAWFRNADADARSAVHVTNTTKQTLPPGTVAIFTDGGFAGESALDRLKPSRSRIVEFGADLDVKLRLKRERRTDRAVLLEARKGKLVEHFERHHRRTYEIENRSGSPRTVFLDLDLIDNARVEGADELSYDTERQRAIAAFKVGTRAKRTVVLQTWEGFQQTHPIAALRRATLRRFAASPKLGKTQRRIVRTSVMLLEQAESRQTVLEGVQGQIRRAHRERMRLTETLDALKESDSDAYENLANRLVTVTNRESQAEARIPRLVAEKRRLIREAHFGLRALNRVGSSSRSRSGQPKRR